MNILEAWRLFKKIRSCLKFVREIPISIANRECWENNEDAFSWKLKGLPLKGKHYQQSRLKKKHNWYDITWNDKNRINLGFDKTDKERGVQKTSIKICFKNIKLLDIVTHIKINIVLKLNNAEHYKGRVVSTRFEYAKSTHFWEWDDRTYSFRKMS